MSQSDRIQYRKLANQLKIAKFNPVFDSGDYTRFKTFNTVNHVKNVHLDQNDLVLSDPKILNYYDVPLNNVLNQDGDITCPSYLCEEYTEWPNRVPLAEIYSTPIPQNYFYWENFNVCFGDLQGNNFYGSNRRINGCDIRLVVRSKNY